MKPKPTTPILRGYEQGQIGAEYQRLLEEVVWVIEGHTQKSRYHTIRTDAKAFAPLLAQRLRANSQAVIAVSEEPARSLASYQAPLDYAALVEKFLGDPDASFLHHKTLLQSGVDVFGAFGGRWSGVWYSDNHAVGAFDHHWQETQPVGGLPHLLVQPVVMGKIPISLQKDPGRRPTKIGSDSEEPTPAVDIVSTQNGWILGAVGFDAVQQQASRPHVGYCVEERLLIWLCMEQNGAPEAPRYSCFFERKYPDDTYRIIGVQFSWLREARQLLFERFMGSVYTDPLP